MDALLAFLAKHQKLLACLLLAPLVADAFLRLTGYGPDGLGTSPHVLEALAFGAGVMGVRTPRDLATKLAGVAAGALSQAKDYTEEEIQAWRNDAKALGQFRALLPESMREDLDRVVADAHGKAAPS